MVNAIDLIKKCIRLWIRDCCQKVLPMQFTEGQCSYFGKKGMNLHAVFLLQSTSGGNKQ